MPRSWADAEPLYVRACDLGVVDACLRLASTWTATQRNTDRVAEHFEKACDLGAGEGCRMAAVAYHRGELVARDARRARELAQKGCVAGDQPSCDMLN